MTIDGNTYILKKADPLPDDAPTAAPGTVLARDGETLTIAVDDGAMQVVAVPATV